MFDLPTHITDEIYVQFKWWAGRTAADTGTTVGTVGVFQNYHSLCEMTTGSTGRKFVLIPGASGERLDTDFVAGGQILQQNGALTSFDLSYSLPEFKSTTAEIRFALCALWSLGPRSVRSGIPYERSELAGALEGRQTASLSLGMIFPKAPQARTRTGNRVFLLGGDTAEEAHQRFAGRAGGQSEEDWRQILESHAFTPKMSGSLANNDSTALLDARDQRVAQITLTFLERMTEHDLEDTPPLDDFDLDDDWPGDDAVA